MTAFAAPPGYEPVTAPRAQVLAWHSVAAAVQAVLAGGESLYHWAARQPGGHRHEGRGPAWGVVLGTERAVVRHSRHGGLLAPLTRDLFRHPTRAPAELSTSLRLSAAGIPTPAVLAFAVYPLALGLSRADVATREVPDSADLGAVLARVSAAERRQRVWPAVESLLATMARAEVSHPDLNAKNVLIIGATGRPGATAAAAWLLDVDVVTFGRPDAHEMARGTTASASGDEVTDRRNRERLARSLRKRSAGFAAPMEAADWRQLGMSTAA